jgi:hypothetical protein
MRTFIALLVTISSLAFAQTEQPKQSVKPKVQNVDFTEQKLEAGRATPLGSYETAKRRHIFDSLIKMRANFNDKLANSVDSL